MKHRMCSGVMLPLVLCVLMLSGCPTSVAPKLTVTPLVMDFGSTNDVLGFDIVNSGGGTLDYQAAIISNSPWLSFVDSPSGTITTTVQRVRLGVDREDLEEGEYTAQVIVESASTGDSKTILVAMTVNAETDPGGGGGGGSPIDVIRVEPEELRFRGLSSEPTLEIFNDGDLPQFFTVALEDIRDGFEGEVVPIVANPSLGTVIRNSPVEITFTIDDPETIETGSGNYEVVVNVRNNSKDPIRVPVFVDPIGLPVVAAATQPLFFPPSTSPQIINFGRDLSVQFIDIFNLGDINSRLFYKFVIKEREEEPNPSLRIISSVTPEFSRTFSDGIIASQPEFEFYPNKRVTMSIFRDNLKRSLEDLDVLVYATDGPNGPIIEEVEPLELTVRVEAAARVEGAINRTRPPYAMRFVFLLRDMFSTVVDTTSPGALDQIEFEIDEEDEPLPLDETNLFIAGPETLRYNLVLLLDYTGSMYNAGTDTEDPERQLEPGEAIEQMEEAAKEFIDDLPGTYRIAVMEYHDRQQRQRVIASFTTDKEALKSAIDAFEIPTAEHGASEIFDALGAASQFLADEDSAAVLPFDEADVRAVVFISDGYDTSSVQTLDDTFKQAQDQRVRLYPLGFAGSSNEINYAGLVQLAEETGGHPYFVVGEESGTGEGRDLGYFLGTGQSVGKIWQELRNQVVMTYYTPLADSHDYRVTANFIDSNGDPGSASFQEDGVFAGGDVRAGQITLHSNGINADTGNAEIFVRTDYIPRNIKRFRFRFIPLPDSTSEAPLAPPPPPTLVDTDLMQNSGGLLRGWRIIDEGNGVFTLVTEEENFLPYGSFGTLMKITVSGLTPTDSFEMGFRVDNTIYFGPAGPQGPSTTRFFDYPGGRLNPEASLLVSVAPDIEGPSATVEGLFDTSFDPEAADAWDRDNDLIIDFDDSAPDDEDVGDADDDGIPDLNE